MNHIADFIYKFDIRISSFITIPDRGRANLLWPAPDKGLKRDSGGPGSTDQIKCHRDMPRGI